MGTPADRLAELLQFGPRKSKGSGGGSAYPPAQVAPSGARVVYATETGELRSGPIAGPDVVLDRGVLDPAVVLSPTSASLSYGFSGGARKLSALDGAGKVDLGAYGSSFPAEFSADGSKLLFPSTLGLAKVATVPAGAVGADRRADPRVADRRPAVWPRPDGRRDGGLLH